MGIVQHEVFGVDELAVEPQRSRRIGIDPGDRVTIGVDVVKTWDDGRVTFSLFGRIDKTTISDDSPQIVKVEKGGALRSLISAVRRTRLADETVTIFLCACARLARAGQKGNL